MGVALCCGLAVRASAAVPAKVHDCASAHEWFDREVSSAATLGSYPRAGSPEPKDPDFVDIEFFKKAVIYYGDVGGGGCLGGYFDAAHGVAAIQIEYDTYADVDLFLPQRPVSGFTSKDLSHIQTRRGARLGMSVQQILAIEGPAQVSPAGQGLSRLHYGWKDPDDDSHVFDLTFLFKNGKVVAIDSGSGH